MKLTGEIELSSYSRVYNMQYTTQIQEDGIMYHCVVQRKFKLELPSEFTFMKKGDPTEKVLEFIKPQKAYIHFYRITSSRERRNNPNLPRFLYIRTKNLNNDISKLRKEKVRKLTAYYGRICRSRFYLNNLHDEDQLEDLSTPPISISS